MADEITVTLSVRVRKGDFKFDFAPGSFQLDMAGAGGGNPGLVEIGTAEEDVAFGDVAPYIVIMQNMDATNYVEWGKKDGGGAMQAIGKLSAGSPPVCFEMASGTTLRMKANTAACKVYIAALPA